MKRSIILFTTLFFFSMLGESLATNGYFSHGYGTQYKGMAGVAAALARSTLGAASNPASMAFLGKRYDIGVGFFVPVREYSITGSPSGFPFTMGLTEGTVESESQFFVLPSLGANWVLSDKATIGLAIYGNGGMNTDYPTATFYGSQPTGVNLMQIFFAPTVTYKFWENHAFGITPILSYQQFKAEGLEQFAGFSSNPSALTNNGNDNSFGFGFRVGYMGNITDKLSFGASYQSKIWMGEFDDYAGLFAEQGDFDIPSSWTAGVAYQFTPKFLMALDVQQIMYSKVKSIANPMDLLTNPPFLGFDSLGNPIPNTAFAALGQDEAWGFGWEDMTILKIGAEYMVSEDFTLRGGFSHAFNQPIPSSEVMFNILAPGVIENHASLGFSKMLGDKELSFAFTHAFSNSVVGGNPLEAPTQQAIELKMHQFDIEVGFSF